MYLSARAVGSRLGLSRLQARTLCAAGLCGDGLETSGGLRYDSETVEELAQRPFITSSREVGHPVDTTGIFVVRVGAWKAVDEPDRSGMGYSVSKSGSQEQLRALDRRWVGADDTEEQIRLAISNHGGQPFVATVAGFVVEALHILDVTRDGVELTFTLDYTDAQWAENIRTCRLNSGSGGPWVWWPRRKGDVQ